MHPKRSLNERIAELTPRRQEIIRPVIENPREFVLLSVRDAAKRLGTDPATMVRIVQKMGFESYRSFQNYLHDLSITNATALDGMRGSTRNDASTPGYLHDCLDQCFKNLIRLRNSLDLNKITQLAKRIHTADHIYIIGGDFATSIVQYLEYSLLLLGLPVVTASTTGRTAHLTRNAEKNDLVIAISFRRGLRLTVEGVQRAHRKGAYCVGITDTYLSPIAQYSDEFLLASIESASLIDSYIAPVALINMIIVACANYDRRATLRLLAEVAEEQKHGFRWYEI